MFLVIEVEYLADILAMPFSIVDSTVVKRAVMILVNVDLAIRLVQSLESVVIPVQSHVMLRLLVQRHYHVKLGSHFYALVAINNNRYDVDTPSIVHKAAMIVP